MGFVTFCALASGDVSVIVVCDIWASRSDKTLGALSSGAWRLMGIVISVSVGGWGLLGFVIFCVLRASGDVSVLVIFGV